MISHTGQAKMDDNCKTTTQLIAEVNALRERVAELEAFAQRVQSETPHDELLARLQLVLDRIPLGCIITDSDLRISYWNAAAERIFGFTQAEVLGKLHYEVALPDNLREHVADLLRHTAQDNLTINGENENITKAGNIIMCEWHSTPLHDSTGRYLGTLAMAQDITARKQMEAALRASEAKLRAIFKSSRDAIGVSKAGVHILVNPAYARMFGYDHPDELVGVPILDHIAPESREIVADYVQRRARGEEVPSFYEVVAQRRDGTCFPMETTVSTYELNGEKYTLVVLRDITERKRVEQALRESEERWRTVVESEPECVKVLDHEGKVVEMNPAGLEMIQATLADVRGKHASGLVVEEDRASFEEMVRAVFRGEARHLIFDMIGLKGRRLTLEAISVPLWDLTDKSRVKFLVGITRDITERKRVEAALRQSEERFRTMFEQAPLGIALVNSQSGQIIEANTRYAEIIGRTRKDINQIDWMSITQPDDLQANMDNLARLNAGQISGFSAERRCLHLDGSVIWINLTVAAIQGGDPQQPRHLAMIEDITTRKQAEDALRRLNRELRAVSDCNQILVRAEDEQTLLNTICHIICDEAGYRMAWVGYAEHGESKAVRPVAWAGSESGYLATASITWADSERGQGPTGTAIRSGESVYVQDYVADPRVSSWRENALQRGYRSSIALPLKDECANIFGALNIYSAEPNAFTTNEIRLLEELANDLAYGITALRARIERKQAEIALRESEARYRLIAENSADVIWVLDLETRRFKYVSPSVMKLRGYTPEEVIAQPMSAALTPESAKQVEESISSRVPKFLATPSIPISLTSEVDQPRKDGSIVHTEVTTTYVFNELGKPEILGVSRNITERKRAEEQLLRAQKLESLGILAGGVAHDFNNLLVALLGQTSLASAKLPPDHPAQRHLDRAIVAARRAADLTRQMLAYSGHGAFQLAPLNLNTLIRENISLLESSISKSITLHTDLAEALPRINADAGQMQQIIMNLILNAAEAIGDNPGTIRLATSTIDLTSDDGRWTHHTGQTVAAGHYVQLRAQDSGSGISTETLGRIFDPFFTTKFTGRGLGLAAVLGIVRGHQGGLWVESETGRGTTFTLVFPATAEETVAFKAATNQTTRAHQFVLVIDDEEPVLEAIGDMLELDGVSTLCAATGAGGISIFRDRHADIGLVLLDLSMPGLSGRETFDKLLQIDPDVRVVLTSGYTQAEATRDFEGRKLAGFLHKPYDMETLLAMARQQLQRKGDD